MSQDRRDVSCTIHIEPQETRVSRLPGESFDDFKQRAISTAVDRMEFRFGPPIDYHPELDAPPPRPADMPWTGGDC
jgi:hypothetical protein